MDRKADIYTYDNRSLFTSALISYLALLLDRSRKEEDHDIQLLLKHDLLLKRKLLLPSRLCWYLHSLPNSSSAIPVTGLLVALALLLCTMACNICSPPETFYTFFRLLWVASEHCEDFFQSFEVFNCDVSSVLVINFNMHPAKTCPGSQLYLPVRGSCLSFC